MAKRILIVEDDPASREIISVLARNQGYEVVAINDGAELLTVSTNERFDLIITDLMMPNMSGVSATVIINMLGNTTPVIALTVLSPEDTHLLQDRFTKIFHKPCNYKELFEYVESLIGK